MFSRRRWLDVPLLGRAEDHDPPAHIGAEVGQGIEILGRPAPDRFVRRRDVQTGGRHEEPVQPDNRHAAIGRGTRDGAPAIGRNVCHGFGNRERCEFDTVKPDLGSRGEDPFDLNIAPQFIANGQLHDVNDSGYRVPNPRGQDRI